MRQVFYGTAWTIFFLISFQYVIETAVENDLPPVPIWKWTILIGTVLLIYFSRNRDKVFKHRVV